MAEVKDFFGQKRHHSYTSRWWSMEFRPRPLGDPSCGPDRGRS